MVRILAFLLALSATAAAQETVRLRSGRVLDGDLQVDPADKDGFKITLWDSGATVAVRWSQLPDAERDRLLGRSPESAGASAVPMIDGIRLITTSREVVGQLVREDAGQIYVKTADAKSPVAVPKNANLLRRDEPFKIRESDAFSPDEMIEARLAKASEADYASMLEVGRFAASLREYERAKEIYGKAAAAPNAKKDEIAEILSRNEHLIQESRAAALLAEARDAADGTDYSKAIELAKKMLQDFAETEVARQNANLPAALEKEFQDFQVRKGEILAQKVPEMYKLKRLSLISGYASPKYKVGDARSAMAKLDKEILAALAEKLKSTPDEIEAAWAKRELKPRTVNCGAGSWIIKGGQEGGLDTAATGQPRTGNNTGGRGGFGFGGGSQGGRNTPQNTKPVPLGQKMETAQEWWATASSSERKAFLETEYARTSSAVKKEEKSKKCSLCQGEGMFKGIRLGYECEWKCGRCHGAKEDLIVVYQ